MRGQGNRCCRTLGALLTIVMAALLAGCAGSAQQDMRGDTPGATQLSSTAMSPEQCMANAQIQQASARPDSDSYVIQPGDSLSIDFYLDPEFNDDVTVRPDGKVTLRLVGDIQAAGQTPTQFAEHLDRAYSNELRSPEAAVHVKNMPSREVFVQGQVAKPGAFPLEPGMTALQAVSDAGGLTPDAGYQAVLIRRDICGRPHGLRVDVSNAAGKVGKGEDVALMPRDILVVPRSTIADMDLFVKQYIQGLLPIPPYMTIPAL